MARGRENDEPPETAEGVRRGEPPQFPIAALEYISSVYSVPSVVPLFNARGSTTEETENTEIF